MSLDPVLIACDESGSEGENVTNAGHRVFVHASVAVGASESAEVMARVRRLAPSQAPEYKADQILRPMAAAAVNWLLAADGPLAGRALVYLVDKDYFVVGKIVDLLVEEVAHAAREDLYAGRRARGMALTLHREGPRALGAEWAPLLAAFNSLMRAVQRKGEKATVDQFFDVIERVRFRSRRRDVEGILADLWKAKPHAVAFQQRLVNDPDQPPALDPLFAAPPQTVRAWHKRTRRPVKVVHDTYAQLTPVRVAAMIDALARPHPDFRRFAPPVPLAAVDQADSKDDPRIQLADLLAGLGRRDAAAALVGNRDAAIRPFVDLDSLWSDDASWTVLTGKTAIGR